MRGPWRRARPVVRSVRLGALLLVLTPLLAAAPPEPPEDLEPPLVFFLEADGHPTLKIGAAIGGVTTREHSYAIISLGPADWNDLEEGVEYTLRPQNSRPPYRWLTPQPLRVRR